LLRGTYVRDLRGFGRADLQHGVRLFSAGSEDAARMALGNLNNLIALRPKDRPTQDFHVETFGKTALHTARVGLNQAADLRLGDLVDLFPEGLPCIRLDLHLPAHEEDPERHREDRAEHQVDDCFRDRQVEGADVDRDPLVLLELVSRVELAPCERARRRGQCEGRREEECTPHSGSFPKYETSDRNSSIV